MARERGEHRPGLVQVAGEGFPSGACVAAEAGQGSGVAMGRPATNSR